jgi:hypothetical protein
MNEVTDLVRFSRARTDLERFARKNPSYDPSELLERLERENDVKQAKKCAFVLCGEPFIAERKDQIYCPKGTCKMAAYRLRNHGYETTDLADILARARDAELQSHGVAGTNHGDVSKAKRYREDALRAAYDALAAELGIVQAPVAPVDELDEPENDAEQDPLTPERVREKLRAWMLETGYGQTKVAKLACVGQPTISQFLNEKTDGSEDFRRAIMSVVTQDHGMDKR